MVLSIIMLSSLHYKHLQIEPMLLGELARRFCFACEKYNNTETSFFCLVVLEKLELLTFDSFQDLDEFL